MSEPIFGHLEHAWRTAEGDISRLFHHGRYHDATTSATVPKGTTMNVTQLEADIRGEAKAIEDKTAEVYNHAKTVVETHLPQLASLAQQAASNPLVDAALNVVHLSPAFLTSIADVVTKAEAELAALQPAPAAPDGPEQPAEPADTSAPADVPAEAAANA